MKRGYKKKNWKRVGVVVLVLITGVSSSAALYVNCQKKAYREKAESLENQLKSYQRVVYVAAEKLPKGSVLVQEKLWQEIRYSDFPQEEFISETSFGMQLVHDVAEGTCITVSMLQPSGENVREVFIEEAELSEHIKAGDRIDLRIRFDNAEDYVVLADKCLIKCTEERGMVLELTEEEILILSSAVADSKRYKNTKLYVVEYPEYEQIAPGTVTYMPNKEILILLGKEIKEGESRGALEQRLMQHKQ